MCVKFLPIDFDNEKLSLLDQRKLPFEESFVECLSLEDGHQAIKDMVVRGAPCIGFAAIFSMALWLKKSPSFTQRELLKALNFLKSARPTAVNLAFELERVKEIIDECEKNNRDSYKEVVDFGKRQVVDSESKNRLMAGYAQEELKTSVGEKKYKILTHCNTGFLACGSIGTALGIVQNLHEHGKIEQVWVDETRPYLQGSRLTAYELVKLGVSHRIVVEGAASYLMQNKLVDAVFVGADRVVANGDTANKIGTAGLAVLAHHYGIPFYVVAPSSSFDLSIKTGDDITIEMRDELEILEYKKMRIAPYESRAFNPSFDITDGKLVTGIINEHGVASGKYTENLPGIVRL